MDAYLALVSKREVREYADEPLPEEVVRRILDAGRLAGSAGNRQPWTFFVPESRGVVEQLAETVYAPRNVLGAKLVIVIVVGGRGPISFDAGRAAQNMMLAAWSEGVGSCPTGMPDTERTASILGVSGDERPAIVLSFGYPAKPRAPETRPVEEWVARANRKPLDEVVRRL